MADLIEPGIDYTGVDFSEIQEIPEIIARQRFSDCRFNSLSFLETRLDGAVFERCQFDFTRIGGNILRCAFLNCSFRYANLLSAEFDGCKMTGSNLADVTNAGYIIRGGDWSYTELAKIRMKRRDLDSANFTGANLFDCRFENCDLSDVRFDNAVVNSLDLKGSKLYGASFAFVNFGQVNFRGCEADVDFAIAFARANGIKI